MTMFAVFMGLCAVFYYRAWRILGPVLIDWEALDWVPEEEPFDQDTNA